MARTDASMAEGGSSGHPNILKFDDSPNAVISLGQIKLMEEFVLFCKTKRALNREKLRNREESHVYPDLKNKLADSFGDWLHKEMIVAICDIVRQETKTKCMSCKATSDVLVVSVLELLREAVRKESKTKANIISHPIGKGDETSHCNDKTCNEGLPNTPTVLLSQSNDDAQSAHGGNAPTVLASPANDSTSNPSVDVINVSLPQDAEAHQVQLVQTKQQACNLDSVHDGIKQYDGKESVKVDEVSLQDGAKPCPAGLCSQLTPKKQSCNQHTGANQQYDGKDHIESLIRKLHKPELPCIETPVVKQDLLNPSSAAKSKSAPVHPMNRRFHYARLDKISNFPRTNLFAPEGLFDLHISDDELGDKPVKKARSATTSLVKDGVDIAKAACSVPACAAPCKMTELVSEQTIPDCDVCITKIVPSTHNPTSPSPQIIDVEHVKPSKNVPQGSPVVQLVGEVRFSEKCLQMSKLTDHMYNSKHLIDMKSSLLTSTKANPIVPKVESNTKKPNSICASIPRGLNPDANRFPVTSVNVRFYDILCGLAYSQWKCEVAVQLVKTTVNFESLGESIEPAGHCDNFFIAGHCRNFFELKHPRFSRKHYFYPKVGYSMLLYNSPYHENVVRFSFLGANSALKLHLADKLCFPICHAGHWFVFIVDLKNKYFTFMDSIYDQFHEFQNFVRNKIIKTFKVAWFLYAEVKLDLSDFTIIYPPVPKQTNADDCGIFAIKYMELWEEHVDLRQRFAQSDIPNIRVILGNNLYFSEKNKMDKSLVNKLYREGINPRLFP